MTYLIGLVIFAVTAGIGIYEVQHWCNAVCRQAQDEAKILKADNDDLRGSIDRTKKLATDMALLWSKAINDSDQAAFKEAQKNETIFATLTDRARSAGAARTCAITGDSFRVRLDASRAANSFYPTPPAAATGGAPAVPDTVVTSESDENVRWVAASNAYEVAVSMFHECRDIYNKLRAAQPSTGGS